MGCSDFILTRHPNNEAREAFVQALRAHGDRRARRTDDPASENTATGACADAGLLCDPGEFPALLQGPVARVCLGSYFPYTRSDRTSRGRQATAAPGSGVVAAVTILGVRRQMATAETALPPMLLHGRKVDHSSIDEPAGQRLMPAEASAGSGVEDDTSDAGGAVTGATEELARGQVPHLPSIKESMPFLSARHSEAGAGKFGEAVAAADSEMTGKRDPAAGVQWMQLSPPFGSKEFREHDGAHRLPPLMPASATTSTSSSPAVCAQCPPNRDPTKVDLKAHGSKEHSASPEGEVPDRVGGMDWAERRKKVKREQVFESLCPRSQRLAHLKLSVTKLLHSLPQSEKQSFLCTVKRYMDGEVSPEEFAEQMKVLVDTHHIMIPLECPAPARKHAEARAVKAEASADEGVFVKPNSKRASAGGDAGKSKSKAPKGPSGKSPQGKSPAGATAAHAGEKGGAAGGGGRVSAKKRKHPTMSSSEEQKREMQGPPRKAGHSGAMYKNGRGGASGKVLHGALTPVNASYIKEEADDEDGEEGKCALSGDEEENSAWDALLSVCAQMPRQKAK